VCDDEKSLNDAKSACSVTPAMLSSTAKDAKPADQPNILFRYRREQLRLIEGLEPGIEDPRDQCPGPIGSGAAVVVEPLP
jgi:hypothetical protein